LDCNEIGNELTDKMFAMIKKSIEQDKEKYILLGRKKDKKIVSSNIITGSQNRVKSLTKIKFPEDVEEFVADFHTHPSLSTRASTRDIVSSAARKISFFCIGGIKGATPFILPETPEDEIVCYDIKDKELLKLGNEASTEEKIEKVRDMILPQMYDRVKQVGYDNILDVKCTFRRKR
jgi:proteasome lid subunit RPN8/RPN11